MDPAIKSRLTLSLVLALVSYPLLIWQTNWKVGLAVFLIIWSNNVGVRVTHDLDQSKKRA